MARLKNRNAFIPNGFRFTQPETGWQVPKNLSFEAGVQALIAHRKGNAALGKKHKWATDYANVANEFDAFNAAVCEVHGWEEFILQEATSFPKLSPPPQLEGAAPAVGAVRKAAAGIKAVTEWLGSGLRPVHADVANKRAAVCASCPQNQEGNFWQRIDAVVAAQLKSLVEVKNEMELKTPHDQALKSCAACDCWNPLKVHVPMEHILANTSERVKAKLDSRCWILQG